MKKEEFTPKGFIDDLARISKFNDNRVLIWYCNLYIEHFVKLLYKESKKNIEFEKCKECNRPLEPVFLTKVKELCNIGLIDKDNTHDKLIEMVYRVRNTVGHELDFNEIKIIENIIKITSQTKKEDPFKLIARLFNNITPWKNLEISSVAVVGRLYMNLEKIKGNQLAERLIFEINPECTVIMPKIINKDDPRF